MQHMSSVKQMSQKLWLVEQVKNTHNTCQTWCYVYQLHFIFIPCAVIYSMFLLGKKNVQFIFCNPQIKELKVNDKHLYYLLDCFSEHEK